MNAFTVHDKGQRVEYAGGMQREPSEGKTDFSLVFDGPMLERWAAHLTKGAKKYSRRNWMKAGDEAALERFRESAARHFFQWITGQTDEDHAAATFFNINGAEFLKGKLKK